ncbi:MAG: porin [Armatimonadetes bacterium]|nr:porin [Armatimonadota bacterium]NIM24308.1 porin [Armatimonadota bacterium]NIM68177.1 porin [Armatimonadota bacterium]NIM76637.1 porin [Armatimonadota bacterium]NIN06382.1 porin [Armatimonadota bacterium]
MRGSVLLILVMGLLACLPIAAFSDQAGDIRALQSEIEQLKQRLSQLEAEVETAKAAQAETQATVAKKAGEHKINGYLQMRYRNDNAPDGKDEFYTRRSRLNLRGKMTEKTGYRVELQMDSKESGKGPGSKVQLRTAYIEHDLAGGRLRLGQTHIPWGYELQTSVAVLWTAERSLFMDRLFPNQRDNGFVYDWSAGKKRSPQISVGLFNGTGINASDNNSRKDPVARVRFPFSNGSAAVSYYDGRSDAGDSAKDGARWGLGGEVNWGRLAFMGEYVEDEDEGADMRGWYAQLGTKLGHTPGFLFAKFDNYDEDTHLSDDEFNRISWGYFYELDARNRLTLVYEQRDVEDAFSELSKWDGDAYYLQWQTRY